MTRAAPPVVSLSPLFPPAPFSLAFSSFMHTPHQTSSRTPKNETNMNSDHILILVCSTMPKKCDNYVQLYFPCYLIMNMYVCSFRAVAHCNSCPKLKPLLENKLALTVIVSVVFYFRTLPHSILGRCVPAPEIGIMVADFFVHPAGVFALPSSRSDTSFHVHFLLIATPVGWGAFSLLVGFAFSARRSLPACHAYLFTVEPP